MIVAGNHYKKRQRVSGTHRFPSTASALSILNDAVQRRRIIPCAAAASHLPPPHPQSLSGISATPASGGFNDSSTADVLLRLRLRLDPSPFDSALADAGTAAAVECVDQGDVQIHLHSAALRRSKYFAALLSDRWQHRDAAAAPAEDPADAADEAASRRIHRLSFGVAASTGSLDAHLKVLELLYVDDLSCAIDGASFALEILPVALELLFEDCVRACVRYLEAVPWSEEDERRVLSVIPFLREEESRELLARVSPLNDGMSEEMLHGLILSAIHNHPNMAFVKAFVAKLLRDFSSRESARRVLDRAFDTSLKVVKESLEEYSSPDFRGDSNETEAIQRLNLHTAMTNARHLLWLVERMIELRVADIAVKEWSEQDSFTADLQRAFRDDAWKNFVPGFPVIVLRCTCRLANAVVAGSILAPRQVRMKLVKDWLPVLNVCKENVPSTLTSHKSLYLELEEAFLSIISTLPLSDAQELLQQCLSFSTRNVEDCPHLVTAFNTWFRRATVGTQADLFY